MAVRFQYIEKGIVHVQWIEKVTIDELDVAVEEIRARIDSEGDPTFVEIVDLLECKAIPFDLRGLRRIATDDPRIVGYVVLKPNTLAQTMAKMLSQVSGMSFQITSTLDEALAAARLMVHEHSPTKA